MGIIGFEAIFRHCLEELDDTFITIHPYSDLTFVTYHNPGIHDFTDQELVREPQFLQLVLDCFTHDETLESAARLLVQHAPGDVTGQEILAATRRGDFANSFKASVDDRIVKAARPVNRFVTLRRWLNVISELHDPDPTKEMIADVAVHLRAFDRSAVGNYLKLKLNEAPDSFSEEVLDLIENLYSDQLVVTSVHLLKADRLKKRAAALQKIPKDLASDVVEVRSRISAYSFGEELNSLLEKVDEGLTDGGDPYDQAASLKHLRTFFEKLHEQVGIRLRINKPETKDNTPLSSCGQALDFLERKDVVKEKMFELGKALYGVLSEEGVHAIKSEQEYVRLCRNMVIEYALVLLFELDRRLA